MPRRSWRRSRSRSSSASCRRWSRWPRRTTRPPSSRCRSTSCGRSSRAGAPARPRGGCPGSRGGCGERSGGCERRARSSLFPAAAARDAPRVFGHASSVVAALAALAPRLVRLAHHGYPDRLLMRLAELDYPLPEGLIAQAPAPERAAARLLVLDRGGAPLRHARVGDLPGFLRAGDVLVVNDTRVIPARVSGRRPSGGRLELLFVAPLGEEGEWEVLVRGTARPGERVHLAGGRGEWVAPLDDGRWRLRP